MVDVKCPVTTTDDEKEEEKEEEQEKNKGDFPSYFPLFWIMTSSTFSRITFNILFSWVVSHKLYAIEVKNGYILT